MNWPMLRTKANRIGRRYPSAFLRTFWQPVTNVSNLLTLSVAILISVLVIQTRPRARVMEEWGSWEIWLRAIGYVGLGWCAISLIFSIFKVVQDDRKRGRWRDNWFIYHEPILVRTERFEAGAGYTQQRLIIFPDAEPGAFVYYGLRLTPAAIKRVVAILNGGEPNPLRGELPDPGTLQIGRDNNGTRLSKGKAATLSVRMLPGTVPVDVRVYCNSFYVGNGTP